jgi:cystathionine beta-lyase
MTYNFDFTPNRRNPNVLNKWTYYPKDILPMWVADMDFPSPKPILDELQQAAAQGVLGYELMSKSLKETIAARMDSLYQWKIQPGSVIAVPGVVSGLNVAARAFGSSKKGMLVQPPVYNEFHAVKDNLGIPQLDAPLVKRVDGNLLRYEIDWDIFKRRAKKAGIFLLCNPHNPLGIVFSRKDLLRMAEICIENDLLIVSDEIHSEILLDGNRFTPIAKLSREIANRTITLVAASKAFNVPGLLCGFAIIPNRDLFRRYSKEVERQRLHVNSMGLHAARVAFSGMCDGWLRSLRKYLAGNREFLVEYVTQHMPDVRMTKPQATYLAWLDFTELKLKKSPFDFFMKKAKVGLSDGKIFGAGGEGHVRLNFGTSRKRLEEGLRRMSRALK